MTTYTYTYVYTQSTGIILYICGHVYYFAYAIRVVCAAWTTSFLKHNKHINLIVQVM